MLRFIKTVLMGFVETILSLLKIAVQFWYVTLPLLAGLLLLPLILRWATALVSRLTFIRRLNRLCRKNGVTLHVRYPFAGRERTDLTLEGEELRLGIRFFPYATRGRQISLLDAGHVRIQKIGALTLFSNRGAWHFPLMRKRLLTWEGNARTVTLPAVKTSPGEGTILLFSPAPPRLEGTEKNGVRPFSDGDAWGTLTVYTADGFLSYIKRILPR